MTTFKKYLCLISLFLLFFEVAKAQNETAPAIQSIAGAVFKTDETNKEITIKVKEGENKTFKIFGKTSFLRVKAGENSLDKAERISLKDVVGGSNVLVRGTISPETKIFTAQTVIVIKSAPADESVQIQGRVISTDASKKEIRISDSSQTEIKTLVIDASSPNIEFRRYASKSLKFSDSTAGNFEQIKPGDSLKSLGNFDGQNSVFKPTTLISAAFRTVGGKITALNLATKEITITDFQTDKPLKLKIADDARLKKITREIEDRIIDVYFKKQSAEKGDFLKDFYNSLPDMPAASLAVGDNIILSTMVDDKNTPVAVSSILSGTDEIFKLLNERRKKNRPPINLGSINL